MKLLEFLNTTDINWHNVVLFTDDDAFQDNDWSKAEIYSDMRNIPDKDLHKHIDVWDIEIVAGNWFIIMLVEE